MTASELGVLRQDRSTTAAANGMNKVEIATGELYGSIWNLMDEEAFATFADAHWNKFRNAGLAQDFLRGRICLDAGCGSGRAVRSMLKDGAAKVYAIDIGDECVRNTRDRNAPWRDRLVVEQGSVLALPFPDDTFDGATAVGAPVLVAPGAGSVTAIAIGGDEGSGVLAVAVIDDTDGVLLSIGPPDTLNGAAPLAPASSSPSSPSVTLAAGIAHVAWIDGDLAAALLFPMESP